jgi:diguanylate cyclase (GGDEF)-like protein
MGNIPLLYSLIFFLAFTIYFFFGIYILNMNSKSSLNKVFFAVCISLCLWSFGFAMANSASNAETCLFWRRISAIGWASIFCILLHFTLILTGKKRVLKKWWLYLLLYLPAAVNIYIYSISSKTALIQYHLVKMRFGWINVEVNNIWDLLYYSYYVGYALICLGMLLLWMRKSSDKNIRKQAKSIIISLLSAVLLASMTDIIFNTLFNPFMPQMAPVVNLIPITTIYYLIKRYGLMKQETINKDELILNDTTRSNLYNFISIAFFATGLLCFISRYLQYMIKGKGTLNDALFSSGFFLVIGFAILIIQRLNGDDLKYSLNMVVILLSIPIISFRFEDSSSTTIWAFPIIFIIISLVSNKRALLISVTIVAIITQTLVWLYSFGSSTHVDVFNYISRIVIFAIIFLIVSYINKIYISKLKENAYQIGFQRLISEVSFNFVGINQSNFDEMATDMLKRIGRFFQVNRTCVFLFNLENNTMKYIYEWCDLTLESQKDTLQDMPFKIYPWLLEQFKNNKMVYIENINKIPDEASDMKELLSQQNIKSLILFPIEGKENSLGFIGITSNVMMQKWSDEHIKQLTILANLFADGLFKVKTEKEIEFMAYYDTLTELPNRVLFTDRVNQAIHLAKRAERFIGVIFIDLDNFKTVNDTMGHNGGDLLIKEVASTLSQRLRKSDTIGRFGGDEFMIMLNNIVDEKDITKITENIMRLFKKPIKVEGQEFFITASAGVAVYPVDGEDTETLIKNADIAMYKAKSKGKNQYVLCTTDMKDEVYRNMVLSNDLYRAQERDELLVYYQPQIRLQTGQIIGVEALLRWRHPKLGMISPGLFIPLAEKNGLINSIGEWVLNTACIQNKKWQDMGFPRLRMAVNLSISQFKNPKLADNIDSILKKTGLNPGCLELEITESIAIKEADYIIEVLKKLKLLGITISIDDFGTQYSSLSRLKMLPIDRIKIDMQFVQGIESNGKDKAITKVIINLAKSLDLEVIAEGVETQTQLEYLNQKMCDEVQGFFYYKPMPADEVEKILSSGLKTQ